MKMEIIDILVLLLLIYSTLLFQGKEDENTNIQRPEKGRGRLPVWSRGNPTMRTMSFQNNEKGGLELWMRKSDAGFNLEKLGAKNSESVATQNTTKRKGRSVKNSSLNSLARKLSRRLTTRQFPADEYNAKAECPTCTLSWCRGFDGIVVFCRECEYVKNYKDACTKQVKFPAHICDWCRKEKL